jgi:hypothetical protein
MNVRPALRTAVGAALIVGSAGVAYPWTVWQKAGILAGSFLGYYYGASYTTIHSFNPAGGDGGVPAAGLTPAGSGALVGTTSGPAAAYVLVPPSGGATNWSEAVLTRLGAQTASPLTPINAAQMVGTEVDNPLGQGDVYILTNNGGSISKDTLYVFNFGGGPSEPTSGLLYDSKNVVLYGTASGGPQGGGVVYKLKLANGVWKPSVLATFASGGAGGSNPAGELVFGRTVKTIFGTTQYGGNTGSANCQGQSLGGCGVAYSLSTSGGSPTVLYSFAGGTDGAVPGGLMTPDGKTFYGATQQGGNGQGTVFSVNTLGTYNLLYSFANTADGHTPNPELMMDASGALYGTAQGGGYGQGTAFVLVPPFVTKKKNPWSLSVLHSFGGSGSNDGATPAGRLVLDTSGNVYGVTSQGGAFGYGTAYMIVP